MRVLSKAFFNLKRNIPWVPADTKLSKLDTLRLAKNYITYLAATLDGQSVEDFSTNLAQPPKTVSTCTLLLLLLLLLASPAQLLTQPG